MRPQGAYAAAIAGVCAWLSFRGRGVGVSRPPAMPTEGEFELARRLAEAQQRAMILDLARKGVFEELRVLARSGKTEGLAGRNRTMVGDELARMAEEGPW